MKRNAVHAFSGKNYGQANSNLRRLKRYWSNTSLGVKGAVVVLVPILLLTVSTLPNYFVGRKQAEAIELLEQTHNVQKNLQNVYFLVARASNGVRSYLLTQESSFLQPLRMAQRDLPVGMERLRQSIQSNQEQSDLAQQISRLGKTQVAQLTALSSGYQLLTSAETTSRLKASKKVLDDLRDALTAMTLSEDRILKQRTVQLTKLQRWQNGTTLAGLVLGVAVGIVAMMLFLRSIARRITYVETNAKRLAQGHVLQPPLPGSDVISQLSQELAETAELIEQRTFQLYNSEARMREVLINAPVTILALDAAGIYTFVEGRGLETVGRRASEMLGQSVFEIYKDSPELLANNRAALSGQELTTTIDLAGRSFETRYQPHFTDGKVSGVVVVGTEVTEQKQAETALINYKNILEQRNRDLIKLSQIKDEFFAKVSHELRTPLTAIIGFSDLLKDDFPGEEGLTELQQKDYASIICDSGHHLLSIINDLLDLSKIEAGMMQLTPAPIDLSETISNALTVIEGQASKKELHFDVQLPATVPPLIADERRVKQVLYNLLSNAVKFTPECGRIELALFDDPSEVRIQIRDSGPGITPENQQLLFQPYTQFAGSCEGEGTGLGLAVAKQLIELHGGRLWVESQVGHGCTFGFSLPRARDHLWSNHLFTTF